MSQQVLSEEVILIESEEDHSSSEDDDSAYSSSDDLNQAHSDHHAKTLPMETSSNIHDTSLFEKEMKSRKNNFLSKYIGQQGEKTVDQQARKKEPKQPLETTSQSTRNSVHLTRFTIDDEDIIDFGKPLTSNTTSANINIESKNNANEDIEEEGARRKAVSSEDDLIKLEDDVLIDMQEQPPLKGKNSEQITIEEYIAGTSHEPIQPEIKKELSFYQKWFGFSQTEEVGGEKVEHQETPRRTTTDTITEIKTQTTDNLPIYKIAILGEDLSDSLIAAEFIEEEFKKSTMDENIMKKQFDFGGKPYQLELFFYDMYEQFVNMMDQCLKGCHGFLIVYNVASRRSFQQVDILYEKLYRAKDGGTISMVLVGIEYTSKTNTGSPPSSTTTLLQTHSNNQTPLTNQPSPVSSTSVNRDHIGKISTSTGGQIHESLYARKASIVSTSSTSKYWNNPTKHHSFRSHSFVTSQNGKERQVSKREGLKKSLFYYVPFIEMNSDEPKTLIQQKVKEIFHELLREIVQGGNLRFSAVKPQVLTNSQYLTSQLGSWNGSEKNEEFFAQDNISPNQDSYNIIVNSFRALFTNLNVHGYCLNTPISDEHELNQIEFLVDHFESYQVTCKVIEICLKRFDFRNVKLKLRQKVTPHNEQQILSFLFDIPLKKKNILQMMFTKSDENYQREINERLIFAIFIATFAKQLYSEQNQRLYDGTFMVSLEDEWNFILNLKNMFETIKKKVKEYSSLEELVEDQVIRMVDFMEKKIYLKRGNEIEMLMKFLLQHVTSPVDCYGFETRVRPHVLGNRYLILKRIFSNHHSKIYKSVKVKTSTICALKHLTNFTKSDLTEVGKGVESMVMFPKHENVMVFMDYTVRRCRSDRFEIFIELPFMNASNMEKRLEFLNRNNRFMNYVELVDIYLQSSKGLQHLHKNAIVFPSLKLEKILMNYIESDRTVQKSNPLSCATPSESNSVFKSDLLLFDNTCESFTSRQELKSVIIKAFDENESLLGESYRSNLNVKLTDWYKPWDFSILDGTSQFKNRQVMEQYQSNHQQNEWSTIRSSTPTPTTNSSVHSTIRKQMALHEIMSNSSQDQDRFHFDGDIERYLDEKDDVFRLGCVFYQLLTKESFIKFSSLVSEQTSSNNSAVSSPTSTTTTVVLIRNKTEDQTSAISHSESANSRQINGPHNLDNSSSTSMQTHPFEYISIEEAVLRDEKLAHQIMASKIHMSLLKSEAIPHLTSPRLISTNSTTNSSVGGIRQSPRSPETSPLNVSPTLIASPQSADRISPSSSSNGNVGSNSGGVHLLGRDQDDESAIEKSRKCYYHCSHNNEQLLIGLIQQMLRVNPNQRPSLKKIILILEVLMKHNQIDQDIVETLLSK